MPLSAPSLKSEGAGNAGRVMRTHSLVCKNKKHTSVVTTGPPKRSGIPCANGFNGFLRALLGDRAFLPPSQATMRKHHRQLDTSVGISGPHDFAVRDSARSSCAPSASTASRANVRDDSRNAPLVGQDGERSAADLGLRSTRRACDKLTRRANQFDWRKTCQVRSCVLIDSKAVICRDQRRANVPKTSSWSLANNCSDSRL
jgi:hypothetical protein